MRVRSALISAGALLALSAATAQIVNESVKVGGAEVDTQKMTLQCVDVDVARARLVTRKVNIHLVDRKRLPSGVQVRLAAHGVYWWDTSRWESILGEDENGYLLHSVNLGTPRYGGGRCATLTSTLDRNKLTLQHELQAEAGCELGQFGWMAVADLGKPAELPSTHQCQLRPYETPPTRIGF